MLIYKLYKDMKHFLFLTCMLVVSLSSSAQIFSNVGTSESKTDAFGNTVTKEVFVCLRHEGI